MTFYLFTLNESYNIYAIIIFHI